MSIPIPKEFSRFSVGATHAAAHDSCVAWIRAIVQRETLYDWASRHPDRRELPGRVTAYSVPIPNESRRAVVRHSMHGGLLGPLRGDLFFPPTRAPYELLASYVLASSGVRTPPVLGFAVYRAGYVFRRSDVVTLELPGMDLGSAFLGNPDAAARRSWLVPLAELVKALTRAGAWHQDLNVRNILLATDATGAATVFVLDVDRVQFVPAGDPNVRDANIARFERSVRKWRSLHGAGFDEDELRLLRESASVPA